MTVKATTRLYAATNETCARIIAGDTVKYPPGSLVLAKMVPTVRGPLFAEKRAA